MPRLAAAALAALVSLAPLQAAAAVKVTESDLATLQKIRYAKALAGARRLYARGDKAKLAAAEAEAKGAAQAAGWSDERFGQVNDAVGALQGVLEQIKRGEVAESDLDSQLEEPPDPVTVATVRAHLDELSQGLSQKAEQQVRAEAEAERRGAPPTAAQLQGTWTIDFDATVELIGGSLIAGEERAKLIRKMRDATGEASYTFGPGSAVVTRSKRGEEKGTYRVEGSQIFFRNPATKREEKLDVGMRNGKLQMGMGVGLTVFSRR